MRPNFYRVKKRFKMISNTHLENMSGNAPNRKSQNFPKFLIFWSPKERPTVLFFWSHGTPRSGDSYDLQVNQA